MNVRCIEVSCIPVSSGDVEIRVSREETKEVLLEFKGGIL